jgi:hypothetical protein
MPQMAGEFVLKKHGIDPQKDLNLIQNVDYANIAPAFAFGNKIHYLDNSKRKHLYYRRFPFSML